tara:strand:+ start:101 stop:397 length:297 start_codon:yes stop_codon:yes gene_type:complete
MKNKKNYLFSAFSRPPKFPLSVVVKSHRDRDVIYVTYGNGRKNGGGSWSEDITNMNPRTLVMISKYLSPKVFQTLKYTINKAMKRRENNANRQHETAT